ncbi:MAG: hypothetical protein FK734_21020 [Asgard group archaeon]|nr:hypothetical protein [Asgard group archaeon]
MRAEKNRLLVLILALLTVAAIGAKVNIKNNAFLSISAYDNVSSETTFKPTAYEIPTLPGGPVPDWDINITGIGITNTMQLNLSYLVDEILAGNLYAYEQTIEYKDNTQVIIGIDILQLVQNYGGAWYAGEFTFYAEDGYSKSLNATNIVYSYHPPPLEVSDIKILLAFAVNGTYLEDSDWADEGAIRLVCPSNNEYTYFSNMWVGNVTEISVEERWMCHVFVNDELITSIEADTADTYTTIDYLTYDLYYHEEITEFQGPSVLSILDFIGISLDNITKFEAVAPDNLAIINVSELAGDKPAMLAMIVGGEYLGFNGGPMRLVGGNLGTNFWMKNCYELHITTIDAPTTVVAPGFGVCTAIFALISMPAISVIIRRRK